MNIIIDPNVFRASFHDENCKLGVIAISREIKFFRFFRDKQGVLEREYRQIYNQQYKNDSEHLSISLLKYILFEDGEVGEIVSNLCDLQEKFKQIGCSSPVELELLGMLRNGRDIGLVLGMVGYDAEYISPRGLHKEEIRWKIRKLIPWLHIKWFGKSKIEMPESDYSTKSDPLIAAKSDAFESKSALYLQSLEDTIRCIVPPNKGDISGEQVDVYGYRLAADGTTTVIIGECKLRRCGNEGKLVEAEEVQQLREKVIAAQKYEAKRNKIQHTISSFEGILITNAEGLEETARELVQSEDKFRIRILLVTLSKDWEKSNEWRIISSKWLDFGL